jgi:hypothetical protein
MRRGVTAQKTSILSKNIVSISNFAFSWSVLPQDMQMGRYMPVSRFGLMHMVATNLCEWLYVLVEETKHDIEHLSHLSHHSE